MKPYQQRIRVPHLGARAHEHRVHEGEDAAQRQDDGRRPVRTLDVAAVDAVDPPGIQVQEVEDDVAAVADRQDEVVGGGVGRGDGEQDQVEDEVRPHRRGRRAIVVDVRQIARQPAVDRALIERARGARHRGDDDQDQRRDHQDHEQGADDRAAAGHHRAHGMGNAGAGDDVAGQHALEAEIALEGDRHQDEQHQAQQAGIEDGLEGVGRRILELARVADRGLEAVGRPGGDEHAAQHQGPAGDVPGARIGHIRRGQRHEGREVLGMEVAVEERHHADDEQRDDDDQADDGLHAGRTRMPRCWMAKASSIRIAPMKKVQLKR